RHWQAGGDGTDQMMDAGNGSTTNSSGTRTLPGTATRRHWQAGGDGTDQMMDAGNGSTTNSSGTRTLPGT
ncbi:hypothetical protein CJ430_31790, partial [Klebsiella pneumoniae]